MQKKLIALAVAGLASTAAFAQTNVVVYGVADGTFDYVWQSGSKAASTTVNTTTNAAGVITAQNTTFSTQDNDVDFTRVSANSSYIGFKGSEDLGNGLKALFQYEMTVRFDNSTNASGTAVAADRDSFVGLSHAKAGTVVLGNLTGPTRALGAALDVNPGATGIGANSGLIGKIAGSTLKSSIYTTGLINNNTAIGIASTATGNPPVNGGLGYNCGRSSTCTSIFDTRWSNAIAYLSPNWGGFSFAAAYVANENNSADFGSITTTTTNAAGVSTVAVTPFQNLAKTETTGYDLGAKWEGMGFMAAVTYNWAQLGDWVETEVSNLRVGGMYTAPNWSIRAMWEKTELEMGNNFLFGNTDQQKFGIGGTFSIGKTTLLAQWYGTDDAKDLSNSKANLYEVGALYNLSKRTMLKATWAMIDNDDGSAADFGVNAIGNQSLNANGTAVSNAAGLTTTTNVTTSGFGARNQGIQVGIRHSF
jgi:predicted porin